MSHSYDVIRCEYWRVKHQACINPGWFIQSSSFIPSMYIHDKPW